MDSYSDLRPPQKESVVLEQLIPRLRKLEDFDLAMMICEIDERGLDSMMDLLPMAEQCQE